MSSTPLPNEARPVRLEFVHWRKHGADELCMIRAIRLADEPSFADLFDPKKSAYYVSHNIVLYDREVFQADNDRAVLVRLIPVAAKRWNC